MGVRCILCVDDCVHQSVPQIETGDTRHQHHFPPGMRLPPIRGIWVSPHMVKRNVSLGSVCNLHLLQSEHEDKHP